MTPASLFWGVVFGAIGLAYFMYGKKQTKVVPMVCGVTLMVFPYFISNDIVLVVVGLAITAVPYFVRY